MNLALVEQIVNAVLYEGYMLYPYRPSSVKNRHRWTFGGVYPQAYSLAQGGTDAWSVQTECLVLGDEQTVLDVKVRFLHLLAREVGKLVAPLTDLPEDVEPAFQSVEALEVDGQLFQTWQEAVEREVCAESLNLSELVMHPQRLAFSFPSRRDLEYVRDASGEVVGVIVRSHQSIEGAVDLAVEHAGDGVLKMTVQVLNLTPLPLVTRHSSLGHDLREEALMRSFVSTHTILGVRDGEFVSLTDPPEQLSAVAAGCRNIGAWPVLVGEAGERDMLLASPIILYDYPQIAPESPGDLFDGTEIDEILTLRIMTMTEEEKREMCAVDERTRALLNRTETLAREQLLGLHGTVRGLRPLEEEQ